MFVLPYVFCIPCKSTIRTLLFHASHKISNDIPRKVYNFSFSVSFYVQNYLRITSVLCLANQLLTFYFGCDYLNLFL